MTDIQVTKLMATVPFSSEQLADARETQAAWHRWMTATPEQRAQWEAEQAQRRAEQRTKSERVQLALDILMDRAGWSREYAEHFVQSYCECSDGMDGWDYCQHASDEGVTP